MIGLLQRVSSASVTIANAETCRIEQGILAFIGIEKQDTPAISSRLLDRILGYRIFMDDQGKMNLDLKTIKGGLLLVPQFTLAADTRKGMRPGFSSAAPPETGKQLFNDLVNSARKNYDRVEWGEFGADMQISLVNDGPATFWLQV